MLLFEVVSIVVFRKMLKEMRFIRNGYVVYQHKN
jgi:hypothetical protein